ncbi:MAG: LysR family transcriptional regulator [Proteobacteria bacterium]|nr:LysR family transcriptional regulator [Pseudomonadota bacterium]
MQPLDDFYYFAKVIEYEGYAKAARALSIPKSRLSRHVAALEARLGVRLVNRSTRRFVVTEVGQEVHKHALAMLTEADAAVEAVEFARAEPRGIIKASCPISLAQGAMAQYLPEFLARYPKIRLMLHATNRRVDVLNEGFDVALRVRTVPTGEDGLVMRTFGSSSNFLVAAPEYLAANGRPEQPDQVAKHATLSFDSDSDRHTWELFDAEGKSARIEHTPRLVCHDFIVMRTAVLAGLGIALLPESVIRADLESGKLEQVLPAWTLPLGVFHLVFPTRRGLLPSVRAFIDFLAERMPRLL